MERKEEEIIISDEVKNKKGWKCGMATLPKPQVGRMNNKDNKTKKE